MEDFIKVISDYVRAYRMMHRRHGTYSDDVRVAKSYYQYKVTDPDLTLKSFLDGYFTGNA
ncbi:MAG: hypothetical protein GF392_06550 [Candidatus Omnitrophica bacterium]|nr:hypothetical protein [Candidatus Omnitrophota bacterium]